MITITILTVARREDVWECWLRLTDGVVTWDLPANAPRALTLAGLESYFQEDKERLWAIAQKKQHEVADREVSEKSTYLPTWCSIRQIRNGLLYACDWTQGNDSPLTGQTKQAWKDYRQALRDIPQTYANSDDVVWPARPG